MKAVILFIASLLSVSAYAGVKLEWTAAPDKNVAGYYLYLDPSPVQLLSLKSEDRMDVGTNLAITVNVPPGTWYAMVSCYSTNNSEGVQIEGKTSNQVVFYIPGKMGELHVNAPLLSPPTVALSSNATIRVTGFLQMSTDKITWSEGVPIYSYDVNDGPSATYRLRMEAASLK